jgi:hypothetical protein
MKMEVHVVNGIEYALGCLERTAPVGAKLLLESAMPLIPKSDWRPVDLHLFTTPAWNQGQHGACVGFGCTRALDTLRNSAAMPHVDLSPWDLYRQINGGRDAGANIHDALTALEKTGVCTLDLCPSYTNLRRTSEQIASGKLHVIQESFDCPTKDMMATALQLGFPMPFGVSVTTSWEPDKDGWIWPRGSSRGGHCILGAGFIQHPVKKVWGIPFCNSWTAQWGLQGWGIYPLDLISEDYADAWACRLAEFSNK